MLNIRDLENRSQSGKSVAIWITINGYNNALCRPSKARINPLLYDAQVKPGLTKNPLLYDAQVKPGLTKNPLLYHAQVKPGLTKNPLLYHAQVKLLSRPS